MCGSRFRKWVERGITMTNATFSQATGLLHQHGCGVGHFSVSFTIVQEQSHYLTVLNEPHVLVRKQSRIDASKRHRQFPSFNTPLSQTGSVTSKRCLSFLFTYQVDVLRVLRCAARRLLCDVALGRLLFLVIHIVGLFRLSDSVYKPHILVRQQSRSGE